jgi:hypothetical protein
MQARKKIQAGNLHLPSSRDEAVLNASGIRVESVLYDFSQDGGAVGTISFGRFIPSGAIINKITSDEITALTSSGSATVTVKAGSTSLTAALAFDTGFAGIGDAALTDTDGLKLSADSELKITIGTAALTAGKLRLYVQYLLPNDVIENRAV